MFDSLHAVYPLLVAAGVAIAVVPLGAKLESPEKIPYVARIINETAIILASFFAVVGALLVLLYVSQPVHEWLIYVTLTLIQVAYTLLVIAYVFPFALTGIHPLWRASFYRPFEMAQSKDTEEAKKIAEDEEAKKVAEEQQNHK